MTVEARPDVRTRPLSLAQEQLWFLDQLAPGEATYTILMVWRLHGPVDIELLRRALTLVVARHEALRVTIHSDEGTPYQTVAPAGDVPLPVVDVTPDELPRRIEALRNTPFDLETGPLCRFTLLRLSDDDLVFCQGFHHVITDGWSAAVVNAELSTAYRSLHSGTAPVFDDIELTFTDYAAAQRARLTGDVLTEELAFWRDRLAGLPVLDLPADRPRSVDGNHAGGTLIREYPAELHDLVRDLAEDHGASMFMVLLAAFSVLLGRYTGSVDVPTGVPMLGRPEPEHEALVGMFVNMAVLRADLSGDPPFSELVERIADRTMELYDHQEVAFNQVVDAVAPVRDPDRNPLFDVSVQLLGGSNSGENLTLPGVVAQYVPLTSATSRFDMAVNIIDTGSTLRANVEYSSDLFDEWRIDALLDHLDTVLRAVAADSALPLSAIPLVAGAEREALLAAGAAAGSYVVDAALNLMPRGVPGDIVAALTDGTRTGARGHWTHDLRLVAEAAAVPLEIVDEAAPAGPLSATEEKVAAIFAEVLAVPAVGVDDSFFAVGGNSLHGMRAVSRINKAFGIKLSVRALYGNTTVRAISALVSSAVDEKVGQRP